MVLTSLSKHTSKDFQIIIVFGHSAFITSQSMFVLMNMVLKRYLACWTFSKCQPYSNESYLSIHMYTYKIEADNQLHNCVCGALSIKDDGIINRPVTSLVGHQGWWRVFWEGPEVFKLCPTVFNYAQHIYPGAQKIFRGQSLPWLQSWL